MYKKIAIIAGSAALMFGAAFPVLAGGSYTRSHQSSGTTLNIAFVRNTSLAGAYTGGNTQENSAEVENADVDREVETTQVNLMSTGDARATSTGGVIANRQTGCSSCTSSRLTVNAAFVDNNSGATSDTGLNTQENSSEVERADIDGEVETTQVNAMRTGDARSTSSAWTVANTSVSVR